MESLTQTFSFEVFLWHSSDLRWNAKRLAHCYFCSPQKCNECLLYIFQISFILIERLLMWCFDFGILHWINLSSDVSPFFNYYYYFIFFHFIFFFLYNVSICIQLKVKQEFKLYLLSTLSYWNTTWHDDLKQNDWSVWRKIAVHFFFFSQHSKTLLPSSFKHFIDRNTDTFWQTSIISTEFYAHTFLLTSIDALYLPTCKS